MTRRDYCRDCYDLVGDYDMCCCNCYDCYCYNCLDTYDEFTRLNALFAKIANGYEPKLLYADFVQMIKDIQAPVIIEYANKQLEQFGKINFFTEQKKMIKIFKKNLFLKKYSIINKFITNQYGFEDLPNFLCLNCFSE